MYLQRHKIPSTSAIPYGMGERFFPTTHDRIEIFHNLVQYLEGLHRDGDIDDNTFEGLVSHGVATFVEAEISERVDRVVESKISLERFLELL
jgi:hypothetical protein